MKVSLQAIFRGHEPICASRGVGNSSCCSSDCCCSDLREEVRSRRKNWKNDSTCSSKEDGWNCWPSAGPPKPASMTRPSAEAGRWRPKARGPGPQFGALGSVVRSILGPGRRRRRARNDGHVARIDGPGSTSAGDPTRTEPRGLAI